MQLNYNLKNENKNDYQRTDSNSSSQEMIGVFPVNPWVFSSFRLLFLSLEFFGD